MGEDILGTIPLTLLLSRLAEGGQPCITKGHGRYLAEATSHCLEAAGHPVVCILDVVDEAPTKFSLRRLPVSPQIRRMLGDRDEATEMGAVAIAILLVEELCGYKVVHRTAKGPGFDYWLSDLNSDDLIFKARLECSGLFDGGIAKRRRRVRDKLKQTDPSDPTGLPAIVIVVDFRDPVAEVARKP